MFYGQKKFSYLLLVIVCLFFVSSSVTAQLKNQTAVIKEKIGKKSNVNFAERGVRLVNEGKYEQALTDFKRALLLTPDDPVIYNNIGSAYAKQKRYPQALEAFRQSIAINPQIALTYYNQSIVYDYLNRSAEALASVRKAVEIEPENTKAVVLMCELNLTVKQNKEAVGCYESLRKLTALDGRSMTHYGMALMRAKKVKRAIPVLEEAVRLSPDSLVAYNLLGRALYTKKRYKEAVKIFDSALRLAPGKDELRFNLAMAQLIAGNKDAAIIHYKLLKNSNPPLAEKLYKSIYADNVIFIEN